MNTREALLASVKAQPEWCASEHARAIGVSRERVRQLVNELQLTLPDKRGLRFRPELQAQRSCEACGELMQRYSRAARHQRCRPSKYGVPARSKEYQRLWQRAYTAKRRDDQQA